MRKCGLGHEPLRTGSRTVDEMAHAWVDVTYLDPDEFDHMVAEREDQADNDND